MEKLEEEKAKKKRELEIKEKNETLRREKAKHQQEIMHKSEKLENNLINILKKISKMKIIINELKRNINLDVVLEKNLLDELEEINTPTNILIRVENNEEGTVYYWNTETFHNRYDLMKELFNKFNDEDLDIQNLKKEEDPLWDEAKPVLLGFAFYKLEPVSYLMSNLSEISIVSSNSEVVGKIEVDIIPHDENGMEYDEVPEVPTELIGQTLLYKVVIMNLQGISKNLSYNIYVEYQNFYDHSTIKTKVYNKLSDKDNNDLTNDKNNFSEDEKVDIEINESFEHKIDYLTKEDIDFLVKDKVCFKIYSTERIEKKGKTPIEEILPDIKEPVEEIKNIDYTSQTNYRNNDNNNSNATKKDDEPIDVMKKNNDKIDKKKEENSKNNKTDKNKDKDKNKKGKKDDCNIY